ncbi:MAG: PAS domain-containing protein [Anaerolineaceae bacterium]|nr:PAS domain-containing protein [Anaerolineaceae bacterium]
MNGELKLLMVEDTIADAELVLLRLSKEGFNTDWRRVETKNAYLDALEEHPDLILADWSLPQFSGMHALRIMKEQNLDIPFIIVSGNIGEEAAVEAMHGGAYDYILKDRPERLGQAIRNALEQKELRDIQKQAQLDLQQKTLEYQFLAKTALFLPTLTTEKQVFEYIATSIPQIAPGIISTVIRVPSEENVLYIDNILGINKRLFDKSLKILGVDLLNSSFEIKQAFLDNLQRTRLYKYPGGFVEFTALSFSPLIAKTIEKLLSIKDVYTIGLASTDYFMGGIVFFLTDHSIGLNRSLLESFVQQCFMALSQIRSKASLVASEENFRQLAENILETFWLYDPKVKNFIYASPAFEDMWGRTRETLYTEFDTFSTSIYPDDWKPILNVYKNIKSGSSEMDLEHRIILPDGSLRWIHTRAYPVYNEQEELIRIAGISEDISERIESMRLLLNSRDRLRRAEQVSQSGNWEFNMQTGLVHASKGARQIYGMENKVWTIDQIQTIPILEYRPMLDAAMKNLIENNMPYDVEFWIRRQNDGETLAIHSVAEYDASREIVFGVIQDITSRKLAEEAQVKSGKELRFAYDATIEGWSRAMDLRDEETEGHTRRVTETTLNLARLVGVDEEQMIHIRRGALLHDIGKLGVPDAILHKPGPLTPDEWVIMKKHPEYAFQMLESVDYLRPALVIPYCHHERWDGSGYPRGKKGEEIPLAARIFSIIDVWDALTSDRPYRDAWSKEKTLEYIKEHNGIFFDPEITPIFLDFIDSN